MNKNKKYKFNVDIDDIPGIDIKDDVTKLDKIKDNSCEIIYASHVLEHFGRNEFESILKLWNKKLKLDIKLEQEFVINATNITARKLKIIQIT